MTRLLLLCLFIACGPSARPSAPAGGPSAVEIMKRMAHAYATTPSYVDHGTARTTNPNGQRHTTTFTTAFVRPDRFRFEYREDGAPARANVIWLADGVARSYGYVRPREITEDVELGDATGRAVGASGLASMMVPMLLMPDLGNFQELVGEPRLEHDEAIEGHACWRIAASNGGVSALIWIDKKTDALRRLRFVYVLDRTARTAGTVENTLTYDGRLGGSVDPVATRAPDTGSAVIRKTSKPVWLGIQFDPDSALVKQVVRGAPAAGAGIVAGDRVLAIDDEKVATAADVIRTVSTRAPGTTVAVLIERGGAQQTVKVTLEERPDTERIQRTQLIGKPAPALSLSTLDGKTVTLADLKGHVVVVDFWATWCRPCLAAMPHLVSWHKKLGPRGLVIIGVSDEDAGDVAPFVKEHALPYTIALDPTQGAWRDFFVSGIPTTVIIDKTGVVREVAVGLEDVAGVEAAINDLLTSGGTSK